MAEIQLKETKGELLGPKDVVKSRDTWNDQLEALQFLTRIFSAFGKEGIVTSDFVLAKLDEKQRNFIIESTKQAFALKRQIPDDFIASRIFDTMMVECMMISVLHRNIDKNNLLEIVGGVRKEQDEDASAAQETVWQAIKGKLPFVKKEQEQQGGIGP